MPVSPEDGHRIWTAPVGPATPWSHDVNQLLRDSILSSLINDWERGTPHSSMAAKVVEPQPGAAGGHFHKCEEKAAEELGILLRTPEKRGAKQAA